ncbi:MAG: hypothetical protein AWU59_1193 [Methanolobus sp. T82-4]|nr:MAG: hypothetical protein AWU59_1193 [Methanolobus sp. T82-4]
MKAYIFISLANKKHKGIIIGSIIYAGLYNIYKFSFNSKMQQV